jgi:hypothetical protein
VLGGGPRLLRNDAGGGGHSLQLRLRGTRSNRDGLGARIDLEAGGTRQVRFLAPTSGYISQNAPVAHFGLGAATTATVHVLWPRGTRQTVRLGAGAHEIIEPAE